MITVDRNPSYPAAIETLKKNKELSQEILMRQVKYLNNIIEQDHRFIRKGQIQCLVLNHLKRQRKQGIETMHRIKKGQVKLKNLSAPNNVQLFNQLFGLLA